jgi:hypothetical protein
MRVGVLLTAIVLVAACGGSAEPKATADPAELVREVPLTPDEMPNGWSVTPEGDDLDSLVALSPACDVFDLAVVFPEALATARSPSFQGPEKQQAQSFAAIYASESEAQAVVEGTRDIVDRCGDEFKDTLKDAAEDQLEALGISVGFFASVDVSLEDHNDPPLGDGSAGYRVRVEVSAAGSSQKFTVDYGILRKENVVAASQYAAFGEVNEDEELAIARALLASANRPTPTN